MSQVKIYSTPTCPYCDALKSYLKENDIDFEDINVAENESAAKEMVEATGQMGVPVSKIGDEYVVGFNKKKIASLLGLK